MYKHILKITLIIFLNLFAFLSFWIILGALFWKKDFFLIMSIIFSIIPLTILLFIEVKKVNNEFNNFTKNNNERNNK